MTTKPKMAAIQETRHIIQKLRMGMKIDGQHRKDSSEENHEELGIAFIHNNFHIKECMRFVADDRSTNRNSSEICYCGQVQSHHPGDIMDREGAKKNPWSENDIQQFSGSNAFGGIIFRDEHSIARKPSKYLRFAVGLQLPNFLDSMVGKNVADMIDDETWKIVDNCCRYLKDDWKLYKPIPHLAIAVIGGAKQFRLDYKRVETFSRGLIKVTQTTNAWLLTGGFNYGIMKTVGDSVRDSQTIQDEDEPEEAGHRIRCIGVCLWGYIKDRESLVIRAKSSNRRPPTGMGRRSRLSVPIAVTPQRPDERISLNNLHRACREPVTMHTSVHALKGEGYLNPDHSHFLLIDNGYRNRQCTHDNMLMMCLLHRLNSANLFEDVENKWEYTIPSVVVVVEGGLSVVDSIFFAVQIGIPVVICTNTGRAADVLSAAVEVMVDIKSDMPNGVNEPPLPTVGDFSYENVRRKVVQSFFYRETEYDGEDKDETEKIEAITRRVFAAASKTNLFTLFDLTAREDFDSAILSALFKHDQGDARENAIEQMKLALAWDRADIAEEKIFPSYPDDDDGDKNLKDVMHNALVKSRLSFVELLINRDFPLREYLTIKELSCLYKQTADKDKYLMRRFAEFKRSENRLIKRIERHQNDKDLADMMTRWFFIVDLSPFFEVHHAMLMNRPYIALFIWSALLNRTEMAIFFWKKLDHPVLMALTAALLSKSIADRAPAQDSEIADKYNEAKNEYEKLATDLINRCALNDHYMAVITLERVHSEWKNTTCLQTAALADCKKFVGSTICQDVLNHRWRRRIVSNWFYICLSLILCPFMLFIIQFDFDDSSNLAVVSKLTHLFDIYHSSTQMDEGLLNSNGKNTRKLTIIGHLKKYVRFYNAPVTKFCFSTMTSCIFLGLYTYVLLFAYHSRSHNQLFEYILHAWVFTLFCEAIHEIFRIPVKSLKRRASFWWSTIWNKAEVAAILFHIIGIILRFGGGEANEEVDFAAKVFFAFSLFIFIIKLLRILNASPTLGPQLVMIGKMLSELLPFLIIVVLLLLAFGVAHAAFYYTNSLSMEYANIQFILDYSFWVFIDGPELSEIEDIKRQEGLEETCSLSPSRCISHLTAGSNNSFSNISANWTDIFSNNSNLTVFPSGNSSTRMNYPTIDKEGVESKAPSWFLSAFLAFWILLSFLLVNLLIAIFSNVYDDVSKNASDIWKYYQYQMITEFESKQALPPPFAFLGLVRKLLANFIYFLRRKWRQRKIKSSGFPGDTTSANSAATLITTDNVDPSGLEEALKDESVVISGQHDDNTQDPALHFEQETRAAMIRDKMRDHKHGGVVNKLSEIHKQLALIRDLLSYIGRLEAIAEAAVVAAKTYDEAGSSKPHTSFAVISKSVSTRRIIKSKISESTYESLSRQLDNLTAGMNRINKLAEKCGDAIRARRSRLHRGNEQIANQLEELKNMPESPDDSDYENPDLFSTELTHYHHSNQYLQGSNGGVSMSDIGFTNESWSNIAESRIGINISISDNQYINQEFSDTTQLTRRHSPRHSSNQNH